MLCTRLFRPQIFSDHRLNSTEQLTQILQLPTIYNKRRRTKTGDNQLKVNISHTSSLPSLSLSLPSPPLSPSPFHYKHHQVAMYSTVPYVHHSTSFTPYLQSPTPLPLSLPPSLPHSPLGSLHRLLPVLQCQLYLHLLHQTWKEPWVPCHNLVQHL